MTSRGLGYLAATAAVLLAVLTVAVARGVPALTHLERTTGLEALRLTRAHPALETFWSADATVQGPAVARLLLLAGVVALVVARRWWCAGWLLAVLVLSSLVALVDKVPLARPRPSWRHPVTVVSGYSYPSGHATAGWVLATAAVLLLTRLLAPSVLRRLLVALTIGSAVLVSLDRVFLGVHYLSDVVAGALLGSLLALLPWLVVGAVRERLLVPTT